MESIINQMNQIDFTLLLFMLLILLVFFGFSDIFRKRKLFIVHVPTVKTELICRKCDLRILRDFKEGDYIFKITDEKCKKCGDVLVISAIYDVSPRKKR